MPGVSTRKMKVAYQSPKLLRFGTSMGVMWLANCSGETFMAGIVQSIEWSSPSVAQQALPQLVPSAAVLLQNL